MVTSSKILTVSYGTFSCTLEGFDDPFTTLQMVAEYFRRLAAEDRYFGGAPQTPDPETLKRIAQDNNSMGVAAEIADDGIILRQTGDRIDPEAKDGVSVEPTPITVDADDLVFDSIRNDAQDDEPTQEPQESPDPISTEPDQAIEDDALARAESDDDKSDDAEFEAEQDIPTEPKIKPKLPPLTFFRSRRMDWVDAGPETAQDQAVDAPIANEIETVDDADKIDEQAIDSVLEAVETATIANTQRPAEVQTAAQKSVEETLAAIRLNVEQAESSITDEESKTAEPIEPEAETPLVLEERAEETAEEPTEDAPTETAETMDVSAEDTTEAVDSPQSPEDAVVSQTDDDEIETPVEEVSAEILPDGFPFDEAEPEPTETAEQVAEQPEAEIEAEIMGDTEVEADPEQTASTFLDEDDDEDVEPRVSSLSEEQEAELAADLRAAFEADDDETEIAPQPAPVARRRKAHLLRKADDVGPEDEALERLLQTTQSKMDKPEQQRRMNALDQLKAAVAATEADRQVRKISVAATHDKEEEGEAADLAAYREDLRRAQDSARLDGQMAAPSAAARPAVASPAPAPVQQAPLILVSEQRVDEAEVDPFSEFAPEPQTEVAETDGNLALKPTFTQSTEGETGYDSDEGEIQGIPADAFSDATDFSDFAERIGAFELTDLLEAAAAYTSIVEGKSRFSRAQVMSKLAKLNTGDAYTKEAGLRSFGKLLREGKILRVQDGQFGISKASRFSIASRYHE